MQFLHTSASLTGIACVPNKSKRIMDSLAQEQPETITRLIPYSHASKPVKQLKGPVQKEMFFFHKQKNRNKLAYLKRKENSKDGTSDFTVRHQKIRKQIKSSNANEDLIIQDVDDLMKTNYPKKVIKKNFYRPDVISADECSSDSDDQNPALTGTNQIIMERDTAINNYKLIQDDKELELGTTHFQPVFFAKGTDDLRKNPHAQNALKQFREFPNPDSIFNALNNLAISKVYDGGGDIEKKIKEQQDKDWIKFQQFIQRNPSAFPGYKQDGDTVNLLLRMNAFKGDDEKKEKEKEDSMSESEDANTSKREERSKKVEIKP